MKNKQINGMMLFFNKRLKPTNLQSTPKQIGIFALKIIIKTKSTIKDSMYRPILLKVPLSLILPPDFAYDN